MKTVASSLLSKLTASAAVVNVRLVNLGVVVLLIGITPEVLT